MTFKGEQWDWETNLWDQADTEKNVYAPLRKESHLGREKKKNEPTGIYMEIFNEQNPTQAKVEPSTSGVESQEEVNVKPVRGRPFYKREVQAKPGDFQSNIEMQLRANGPAVSNECIERMVRNYASSTKNSNDSDSASDVGLPDLSFK